MKFKPTTRRSRIVADQFDMGAHRDGGADAVAAQDCHHDASCSACIWRDGQIAKLRAADGCTAPGRQVFRI